MKIIKIEDEKTILLIANALRNGQVLVLPTETVYGLFCDARNKEAIKRIFAIKQRDEKKLIGIFARDIEMAKEFAEIDEVKEKILQKYWPGKITFILKRKGDEESTIGIRIPDYPLFQQLLKEISFPLVQTSANISGQPSPTKIENVFSQFKNQKNQPDLIIDAGDLGDNLASTVVDLTGLKPKILRQGEVVLKDRAFMPREGIEPS